MIEDEGRVPDWRLWKHVKTAALWQCVALLLNIDPRKVQHHQQAWMTGGIGRPPSRIFCEPQCFQARWFFAQQAVADDAVGPVTWDDRNDAIVQLASFAKWARSVDWNMPAELLALAEKSPSRTSGAESKAVAELLQIFSGDPECGLSKSACIAKLSNRDLGKRALDRVWRRATETCPDRRSAGRKKSNHPAK